MTDNKALEEDMLRVGEKIRKQTQDRAVTLFKELSMMNNEKQYGQTCKKIIQEMMVMSSDIASGSIAPDSADLEDIMKAMYYVKLNRDRIDARGFAEEFRAKEHKEKRKEERADNIERSLGEIVAIGYQQIQAVYDLQDSMYRVEDAVRDSIDAQRLETDRMIGSFSENIEKLAGVQLSIAMEQERRLSERSAGSEDLRGIRNDVGRMADSTKRLDNARYRKGELSIFD